MFYGTKIQYFFISLSARKKRFLRVLLQFGEFMESIKSVFLVFIKRYEMLQNSNIMSIVEKHKAGGKFMESKGTRFFFLDI